METFEIPKVKDIHNKEYQVFEDNVISSCFSLNTNYGATFDGVNSEVGSVSFYLNEDDTLKILSVLEQWYPSKKFGQLIDLHIKNKS